MSNPIVKYLFTACVSLGVLCFDQAAKIFVHSQVQEGKPIVLIKSFLNISYIGNSGGALGLFEENQMAVRSALFLIFLILCLFLIFVFLRKTQNRFLILALSFILGGAVGNYLDRARLGYVIDFIEWHIKGWHSPIFNVADLFITTGILIILAHFKEVSKIVNKFL